MEAADLKSFLTDSVGQPPTDFESGLDDRNRYLDWCALKLREKYGTVKFTATPLELSPGLLERYLEGGTLATTLSFNAAEVAFYIRLSDLNMSVLLVHSKSSGVPGDYLDEWELVGPPIT